MGGTSTQQQNTSQNTVQNQTENNSLIGNGTTSQSGSVGPWAAATPFLSGILGQLNGQMGSAGLTGAESGAYNTLTNNAQNLTNQFAPQVSGVATNLLNGGGAQATDPMVNQAYQEYQRRLNPIADGTQIGQNSGLQPYLDTLRNDITSQVNGSFAAAGRDFSGANQNALGRGIASGLAPVIASQYNTDVSNMLGAAGSLYGAGNTTAGILGGNNQQANANRVAGAGLIPAVGELQNGAANATLAAEAAKRGIPLQTLGLLAQIGVPIAGLGSTTSQTGTTSMNQTGTGTSSGTSNTTGTSNTRNQMSGAQQFALIANGIQNLMPRAPMSFSF
jgi:hypothetical protein